MLRFYMEILFKKKKKVDFNVVSPPPHIIAGLQLYGMDDPLGLGDLKQELNLMPHFLAEMRRALWLVPGKMDRFRPHGPDCNLTHHFPA